MMLYDGIRNAHTLGLAWTTCIKFHETLVNVDVS
jgi:hypothetical protein